MSEICNGCGRVITEVDHRCQGNGPYRSAPQRTDTEVLVEFLKAKYPEEMVTGKPNATAVAIRLLGEYAEVRRIINSGFFEDSVDVHTGRKTRRIKRNG